MALAKLFLMSGLTTFISALIVTQVPGLYQVVAFVIAVIIGAAVAYHYANEIL